MGQALLQMANHLDAIPYAVELEEGRAAVLKGFLDDDALCPADFFRTAISPRSFSLCFCNPPFDSDSDGRVELAFAKRAISTVADGGVLAFLAPEHVCEDYSTIEFLEENCERISALRFPPEVRRFNEVVVLGAKKKNPGPVPWSSRYDWLPKKLDTEYDYLLPVGVRPKVFRISEPPDTELVRLAATSPLRFLLNPPADKVDRRPRPPMSIGLGHQALLLASGFVDGLIQPPGESAHVIRGSASKERYVSSNETTEDEDSTTTRTVISERPKLTIRVLDSNGRITTLQ
jgi:hypothetical protein